jgi:putative flippase GtrA
VISFFTELLATGLRMAPAVRQPLVFVIVGGGVTLIDLALTYLLVLVTSTRVFSVSVGFIGGLVASYLLHAKISFSASLYPASQLPRFAVLVGLNYFITLGVVLVATDFLDLTIMIGKVLSLPIVALVSYFVSKHWVYAAEGSEESLH